MSWPNDNGCVHMHTRPQVRMPTTRAAVRDPIYIVCTNNTRRHAGRTDYDKNTEEVRKAFHSAHGASRYKTATTVGELKTQVQNKQTPQNELQAFSAPCDAGARLLHVSTNNQHPRCHATLVPTCCTYGSIESMGAGQSVALDPRSSERTIVFNLVSPAVSMVRAGRY